MPGVDPDDLIQQTQGLDLRWAHRNLIVSGEIITSEFETPAAGDRRVTSGFVQARWKVSPGFWLAARFGQMLANAATGTDAAWQPAVRRIEIGAGWRVTPGVLLKTGYGFTRTDDDPSAGEHLWGTGIGWRFSPSESSIPFANTITRASGNFQLRKDSPAFKLGCKPVPLEKIGPGARWSFPQQDVANAKPAPLRKPLN